MNALTGAGVCILIASLGIYMILRKEKQYGEVEIGKSK